MHDLVGTALLKEVQELVRLQRQSNHLQRCILHVLKHPPTTTDRVTGGFIKENAPMVPIQPGNTPAFRVSPTFSGAPFVTDGTKASIVSSDPTNFPVQLDLTNDPSGLTFEAPIPASAQPVGGSEAVTVTWSYTNLDGDVATVQGTVTELGIVDDVTGGTFDQIT